LFSNPQPVRVRVKATMRCAKVFVCLALGAQAARIQSQQLEGEQQAVIAGEEWRRAKKKDSIWKFICRGYLKGYYLGRKGHGAHPTDFVGVKECQASCLEIPDCNLATYDKKTGKCWRETVPPQERKVLVVMPRANDCKEDANAKVFWRGDPSKTNDEKLPEGWHLFCNGFVSDKGKFRKGLGKTNQKDLGKGGCMEACSKVNTCNFVTYDRLSGKCWMEHMQHLPENCDTNFAGWSYAKNVGGEIAKQEKKEETKLKQGDGWHFICTGFVTGKYKGRRGYGQAYEQNIGHAGCKKACDETAGCNFITYDTWGGACWMERIPVAPDTCDKNTAGWSYWKGVM